VEYIFNKKIDCMVVLIYCIFIYQSEKVLDIEYEKRKIKGRNYLPNLMS